MYWSLRMYVCNSLVVFVAPVAGWGSILAVFSGGEERPPRLAVLADDLLCDGGAENADVLLAVVGGIPHAVAVEEVLATFVIDFVPQAGGGVQQVADQLLVLGGERAHRKRVDSPHDSRHL